MTDKATVTDQRRWMPHVHIGSVSTECPVDLEDGGRDGWYLSICWFGLMIELQVSSLRQWRRFVASVREARDAE